MFAPFGVFMSFIILFTACSSKKIGEREPIKVKTTEIKAVDGGYEVSYAGIVKSSQKSIMAFSLPGTVKAVYVGNGQKVKKGQLLAELNSEVQQSTYDAALSTEKQAQDAYDRLKKLYDNGSLAEIKWIEVQTTLQKAKSMLVIAGETLKKTRLTSPIDGYITNKKLDEGSTVVMDVPVMEVVDLNSSEIEVAIPEKEIAGFRVGQEATVVIDALGGYSFKAKIKEKGVVGSSLSHTYDLRMSPETKNEEIRPGMICEVRFCSCDTNRVVVIPQQVVQINSEGEHFVWIDNNGIAERRTVQPGKFSKNGVIIKEGLKDGDIIVTEGTLKISNGMKIVTK